jgi:hypothetical protein
LAAGVVEFEVEVVVLVLHDEGGGSSFADVLDDIRREFGHGELSPLNEIPEAPGSELLSDGTAQAGEAAGVAAEG